MDENVQLDIMMKSCFICLFGRIKYKVMIQKKNGIDEYFVCRMRIRFPSFIS